MKNISTINNKIKYEVIYNCFSKFTFQGKNLDISDKNIYYTYYNCYVEPFIYIGKADNYYIFNKYKCINNKYIIFSDKFIIAKYLKFDKDNNIEIINKRVTTIGYNDKFIHLHILYQNNTANEILNNFKIIL